MVAYKKIVHTLGLSGLWLLAFLPLFAAEAAGLTTDESGGRFGTLLRNILGFTNSTLIPFIIGIGFLVFVWGMFQYFIAGGANDDSKAKGKSLMIYATVGFVLIIIFWGVVNLVASSIGLESGDGNTADSYLQDLQTIDFNSRD